MTQKIYIDLNVPKRPRFSAEVQFYAEEYELPGPIIARMLAAQAVTDRVTALLERLASSRQNNYSANAAMEATWAEIDAIVRPFVGESAAMKQSKQATEAPTSAQSDASLQKPELSSSTKPVRTRSTLTPPVRMSVKGASKA